MEPEVSSITDLLPVNNNNNNKVNNFNVIKIMIIIIIIIMAMIRILIIMMMIMDVIWTLRREGGGSREMSVDDLEKRSKIHDKMLSV